MIAAYYRMLRRVQNVCESRSPYIQNNFVEELHRVTAKHQGHNVRINFSPQGIDIGRTDSRITMIVEEFPCRIDSWGVLGNGFVILFVVYVHTE